MHQPMMARLIESDLLISDNFDVAFQFCGPYTYARVLGGDGNCVAAGRAHRKPGDPDSKPIGKALALSRALRQLADEYETLGCALDVINTMAQP